MKIVLLSGEYPPTPGGVGDYTQQLAQALRACGHEITTLTIEGDELVAYGSAKPIADERRDVLARRRGLDWSQRCWPAVVAALDTLRPAWLHIQYQTGAYQMRPGVNLLPWRLRSLAARPRIAVTFHDLLVPYLFPKAGPVRGWVNRRLAADADAVIATNGADASVLQRFSPTIIPIGSNIPVVVPPGFERAAFRARLGVAPARLLVAYFGLLAVSKGVDTLVEALARLELPWQLAIVGGAATMAQDLAYAATVHTRIAALGLADRVITTGHLPATEVSAYLLAADLAALPFLDGASFRRGSLLAALAHGCPVITTRPADSTDAALLAPAALLVPPADPQALAAALQRLATNQDLRAALTAAGPRLAEQFTWEQIGRRHEALYHKEINNIFT